MTKMIMKYISSNAILSLRVIIVAFLFHVNLEIHFAMEMEHKFMH